MLYFTTVSLMMHQPGRITFNNEEIIHKLETQQLPEVFHKLETEQLPEVFHKN